jgi:dTDP-4-amino-4,6-dideoxygalactose transaminase
MKVLDERVKQKRSIFERYKQLFAGHKNVSFLEEPEGCYSNRWLTCALFDDLKMKEAIVQAFSEDNIECRPLWKPMHMQPLYKNEKVYDNRVSESLFNNGLCLPSGTNMTEAHWQRIENCIRSLKS